MNDSLSRRLIELFDRRKQIRANLIRRGIGGGFEYTAHLQLDGFLGCLVAQTAFLVLSQALLGALRVRHLLPVAKRIQKLRL